MRSIQCPRIRCCARIDHVVDGIQRERNVVRHPENSVAAANDSCWRQAIRHPDSGSEIVLLNRKVVPYSRGHQVDISLDCWGTWRKKLVEIARCARHKIREPVKALGPRSLQFIAKP